MRNRSLARRTVYPQPSDRGVALLAVVVVLSTLLVVGVLFAFTVDLDLKASKYYRDAGAAEQLALEGLYRATAEIQYDMWAVNERRAFKLADSTAALDDAAYRSATASGSQPILRLRSKWRQSVETIGGVTNLTDYRWMVDYEPDKLTGVHSGAVYHDEFLPEHTDNSDVWELGLHVNRGDVYWEGQKGRSFKSDEDTRRAPFNYGDFWPAKRNRPWDREWDYVDTRINGDSFYKIFRFELIDPVRRISTYAGVGADGQPLPKRAWTSWKTHLGYACWPGQYQTDSRGGAVNLNQVNNNYPFETYRAQLNPNVVDPDTNPYVAFHYNDSKWIYLYDVNGLVRGRYAAMVWGDCGTPNANYMYDAVEMTLGGEAGSTSKTPADYFRIIDAAYSPRGGAIGNVIQGGDAVSGPGGDIIKSDTGGKWNETLGTAIADHVRARGPITSRAEFNMFLRETGGNGALSRTRDSDGDGTPDIEDDARVIAALTSVHAYENLMGPHWEKDRIVIDVLGFTDKADRDNKKVGRTALSYSKDGTNEDLSKNSSFTNTNPHGQDTRANMWHLLEGLKFFWGPDGAREGKHTPYHGKSPPFPYASHPDNGADYTADEARAAKSQFFSWVTNSSFFYRNDFIRDTQATNKGWAYDTSVGAAVQMYRDPKFGEASINAANTFSYYIPPQINEVGKISGADFTRMKSDLMAVAGNTASPKNPARGAEAFGWNAATQAYDITAYHFVEFIDNLDKSYASTQFSFRGHRSGTHGDGNYWSARQSFCYRSGSGTTIKLMVGGKDVFKDPNTRIISIDGDLDDKYGIDNFYWEEEKGGGGLPGVTSHRGQNKVQGGIDSGIHAGQQASDNPMVSPTKAEVEYRGARTYKVQGLTCRDRLRGDYLSPNYGNIPPRKGKLKSDRRAGDIVLLSHTKHRWRDRVNKGSDAAWWGTAAYKESWGRYLPANYLLVLFPTRYDGPEVAMVEGASNHYLDYVKLPGNLSAGWSCYDFIQNQHPAMWLRTGNKHYENGGLATPVFRRRHANRPARHHIYQYGKPKDPDGLLAWAHGLNANAVTTYLPGAESWRNPRTPDGVTGYKARDVNGVAAAGLEATGRNHDDASWVSAGMQMTVGGVMRPSFSESLGGWDQLLGCPLGFFPRKPGPREGVSTPRRPDMFMRTWRDLMRVAPLEQYFTIGYMAQGWNKAGVFIKNHGEFAIYDSFDNDLNGHTDDLITGARFPGGYRAPEAPRGHFVGDRAVVGRVSINELAHPAAVWYCGVSRGNYAHQTAVVGRKPFKGYNSWVDIVTRSSAFSTHQWGDVNTPYNVNVWYENLLADASSEHAAGDATSIRSFGSDVVATGRRVTSGNSPVFTVYVTAQTLDPARQPLAEIKVSCTLERTWDGKTNLLDFRWIPTDINSN